MKQDGVAGRSLGAATAGILSVCSGKSNLDEYLDGFSEQDVRRTVSHLLHAYFRRKKSIDAAIQSLLQRPSTDEWLLALLRAAATRLTAQSAIAPESSVNVAVELAKSRHADKFVNAVLRNFMRMKPKFADTPDEVLPEAVLRRWRGRFDEDTLNRLCLTFTHPAPFVFRLENGFALPDGLDATEIPSFGGFRFYSTPHPEKCLASDAMAHGWIYVQDPATSLGISMIDFSHVKTIMDLCSAPGGKAIMLGKSISDGSGLYINDKSAKRLKRTEENLRAHSVRFRSSCLPAESVSGNFDLVVADVPCSNTGVFRRRPDALWRFSEQSLREIMDVQRAILENAGKLVAPGGQLLYSTCSIEPEENEDAVRDFLSGNPDFTLIEQRTLIPAELTDGAGVALLKRNK